MHLDKVYLINSTCGDRHDQQYSGYREWSFLWESKVGICPMGLMSRPLNVDAFQAPGSDNLDTLNLAGISFIRS